MKHSNIHTHSNFSDGKFSPEEMLLSAINKGLVSYGLSDHSETLCDESYCMKEKDYAKYISVCRELKEKYAGKIEFFCGLEKDYYSECEKSDFDYLVGSVHYIVEDGICYPIDHTKKQQEDYIAKKGGNKIELAKRYYELVAEHAIRSDFEVQGHFDVVSKFGIFDDETDEYKKIALEALDTVLDNVPYIEMNTGGIFRGVRTHPYPHRFLLERIKERGGKITLTGDSHHVDAVDFFFDESCKILKSVGFTEIWQLRKTGFEKAELL